MQRSSIGFGVRLSVAAFGLLICAAAPHTARAQVVFDNGNPTNNNSYKSDPSTPRTAQLLADTFTFASTTTFNTIVWYGDYQTNGVPSAPDAFTIQLHNTTSGTPNAASFATFNVGNTATRTATAFTVTGKTVYQYSSALPSDQTMAAGTYGLEIINDTTADTANEWEWSASNLTGNLYQRAGGSPTAAFNRIPAGDLSFQLVNVSAAGPEPGSLALFGTMGVPMGLVAVRKLRRRK